MRWLFRLMVLAVCLIMLKNSLADHSKVFISWPSSDWNEKIGWEIRQWRENLQDLPASVEAGIRNLLHTYFSDHPGKPV
ncbi:MAG: hypothetical protein LBT22_02740 [Peptococcaceae bacterium]|nr:hypothetical protein [Peptococcaceae bacterium]